MGIKEWAENEVLLLKEKIEGMKSPHKSFSATEILDLCEDKKNIDVYDAIIKAYEVLIRSKNFYFSKDKLLKLLNELPLTPITDEDFYFKGERDENFVRTLAVQGIKELLPCPRLYRLSKTVMMDGSVIYSDEERYFCEDREHGWTYHDSFMKEEVLDKLFPIKMPYVPFDKPYKLVCSDFWWDRRNSCHRIDTQALWDIYTPDGDKVEVNRFWKLANNGMVEISVDEWEYRKNTRCTFEGEVPAETISDDNEAVPNPEF